MKHELSDMLQDAKSDAPAPRYTVEDALAAGQKRQRQRRALWAVSGSAAVVLAVAGVAAIPQLLPSNEKGSPAPAAAPVTAGKPAAPKAFAYPADAFTGNIESYKVGKLTVSDTVLVTPGYQVASVLGAGEGTKTIDLKGKSHSSPNQLGSLVTYAKDAFDPKVAEKGTAQSVGSHSGYFVAGEKEGTDPKKGASYSETTLSWEYADDSWAVISVSGAAKVTAADLAKLGAGLNAGPTEPTKVNFKLGYVPEGYTLSAAGRTDDGLTAPMVGKSYVRLLKGDFPYKNLTDTVIDPYAVGDQQLPVLSFTVYPAWEQKYEAPGKTPYCPQDSICYRYTDDGKYFIEASGGGFVSDDELRKVLNNVTFANVEDSATWFDATSAIG
ncbi:hypothetical protein GCM10010435_45720 [Winogradskya consettensis]|uniref:Uncharacterized protein n=1 Tax=Winogradskya consettensis TaxID=113560 RepID=A0A919T095_9ACTN|nr:hypothetical protein [Actinoplanes consettensis]GIM82956.1 hypothetical protein Aco04nite_84110 [Actinoplanes consettensis]